ncbi:tetratricopeptide repeat protein [Microbulbifer guangxiensis]|uniref:tetratricopeptide repeat protein n=1 Tax=Microbulbifer guangxiensis TaxID=2904249 RepID=UPI001F408B91|nr:hypothetical protein [Microbulbifer guangxiensis]
MKTTSLGRLAAAMLALLLAPQLWAADASQTVQELQHAWAKIKYRTPEKEQADKFQQLAERARVATGEFRDSAPVWVWSGIIRASYAGAKGGLGALSVVKEAKADLEHAIAIDGSVLDGAAYTSLGSLYYQVPGWPIGFGDDKKAAEYLQKGLAIGKDDIDANYFYADYLFQSKDYQRALQYVQRAEHAPRDIARPVASEGRLGEIKSLKAKIEGKLH